MRSKQFIYLFTLFALIITGCSSQKFPIPTSEERGILVIPHQASNKSTSHEFGYAYILSTRPENPVEIKITPTTSKDFFIIENFPVGKYMIKGVTSVGATSGSVRPSTFKAERSIFGDYFEIKANQVTLLRSSFNVSKEPISHDEWRIRWDFKPLDQDTKKEIVEKLGKLKNAERWTLPRL